jgi:signal transduction histidine kinase
MGVSLSGLFPRLPIRAKLVIAFCSFALLPVAAVGGWGALEAFRLLSVGVRDRLKAETALKADGIRRTLDESRADVRLLAELPTVRALAAGPQARPVIAPVEAAFLAFARGRPLYDQIRFLDAAGREIVRVEAGGESPWLVPAPALQSKRDRYYFAEVVATPAGAVYVSPMDLNIEHGQIEQPPKPVVRHAMAVPDGRGAIGGVVVINVLASELLRQALSTRGEAGNVSLVSSGGFYLARAVDRPAGPGLGRFPSWLASWTTRDPAADRVPASDRLSAEYGPDVVGALLSGGAGTVDEPGLRGRILAFAPIFPRDEPGFEYWVLLHARDKARVLASLRWLQLTALALGAVGLVVALVAGHAAARHFTQPITELTRGVQAIAQGDFDRPVRVRTNDELEDLARQFLRMAADLKAHERRLRDAQARAERRAQQAHALYAVATEILALRESSPILQRVTDEARRLLGGDVAVLRLDEHDATPVAVSGDRSLAPRAQLGAALRVERRVLGHLSVGYREEHPTLADEREFLAALADQAALAVETARLQEGVRLLGALTERERIGEDLHDGILQSLYATALGVEECLPLLDARPDVVRGRLHDTLSRLDVVMRDVRNYVVGLQPEALRGKPLHTALGGLARDLELNQLAAVSTRIEAGVDEGLSSRVQTELFHIGREALANVVKHAPGSRAALTLERAGSALRLRVRDDGAGFDPGASGGGRGLRNIQERARRLGGVVSVESVPGAGTCITIEVPMEVATG